MAEIQSDRLRQDVSSSIDDPVASTGENDESWEDCPLSLRLVQRLTDKKSNDSKKYPCPICTKEFQRKSGRYNHIKKKHNLKLDFGKVHCLERGCLFSCPFTTTLQQHLTETHNIPMKYLNFEFDCVEEFEKWRLNFEMKEVCRFVKKSGSRMCKPGKMTYLYCNRTGNFVSQSKGIRPKHQPSAKISGHCTALIKFFQDNAGKVKATVCATHYGHDKDHRFLRVTDAQKRYIVEKMKSGMPQELLLDSLRSTFVDKLDKIHELSKKDLNNFFKRYNIPKTSQPMKSQSNIEKDWLGDIDSSIDSPVLFYNELDSDNASVEAKDKCLIIMTKGQRDLFVKFCNNGVLYVTTSKLSSTLPLQLTVICVLDDFYEMYPVCFMIDNNTRKPMMKLCFNEILNSLGPITIRALATDSQEWIFDVWCEVMGHSSQHIIANRHVDTLWRQNLSVIDNEAFQGEIYDKLYSFIENADGSDSKLRSLIGELRSTCIASSFAKYLEKNFLDNIQLWSTYYLKRKYNLRDPIDYESSYNRIWTICDISVRYNKSVGYTSKSLIKLLIDLQSNRNRKVAENVIKIRNEHAASTHCGTENVFPFENGVWKVKSERETDKFYEVKVEHCNFDECILKCVECEACVHNFHCVCDNYSVGKTCVHVHLVGTLLKKMRTESNVGDENCLFENVDDGLEEMGTDTTINRELSSMKTETLTVLNDIGKKFLTLTDETSLQWLNNRLKDLTNSMEAMLGHGECAQNSRVSKNRPLRTATERSQRTTVKRVVEKVKGKRKKPFVMRKSSKRQQEADCSKSRVELVEMQNVTSPIAVENERQVRIYRSTRKEKRH